MECLFTHVIHKGLLTLVGSSNRQEEGVSGDWSHLSTSCLLCVHLWDIHSILVTHEGWYVYKLSEMNCGMHYGLTVSTSLSHNGLTYVQCIVMVCKSQLSYVHWIVIYRTLYQQSCWFIGMMVLWPNISNFPKYFTFNKIWTNHVCKLGVGS